MSPMTGDTLPGLIRGIVDADLAARRDTLRDNQAAEQRRVQAEREKQAHAEFWARVEATPKVLRWTGRTA